MLPLQMSAKSLIVAFAFSSLAAGISGATEPTKEYKDAMDYCAGQRIASYDDGVTQANTIAKILLGACRREKQDLFDRAFSGRSRSYISGYEGAQLEQFTGFVLQHRVYKSKIGK